MFATLLVASALACPETDTLIRQAREALFDSETDDELSTAMQLTEQARTSLTCSDEVPARPDQIAAILQLGGVILTQLDREDEAQDWFQSAIRQAPEFPFDETITRDRETLAAFERAATQAGAAASAEARASISTAAGALVDGWPVAPGGRRTVLPGEHIIQYLGDDGSLVSERIGIYGAVDVGPLVWEQSTQSQSAQGVVGRWAGLGLLVAGTAILSSGAYWQFYAGEHSYAGSEAAGRYRLTANLLTVGGGGVLGAGIVTLAIESQKE